MQKDNMLCCLNWFKTIFTVTSKGMTFMQWTSLKYSTVFSIDMQCIQISKVFYSLLLILISFLTNKNVWICLFFQPWNSSVRSLTLSILIQMDITFHELCLIACQCLNVFCNKISPGSDSPEPGAWGMVVGFWLHACHHKTEGNS